MENSCDEFSYFENRSAEIWLERKFIWRKFSKPENGVLYHQSKKMGQDFWYPFSKWLFSGKKPLLKEHIKKIWNKTRFNNLTSFWSIYIWSHCKLILVTKSKNMAYLPQCRWSLIWIGKFSSGGRLCRNNSCKAKNTFDRESGQIRHNLFYWNLVTKLQIVTRFGIICSYKSGHAMTESDQICNSFLLKSSHSGHTLTTRRRMLREALWRQRRKTAMQNESPHLEMENCRKRLGLWACSLKCWMWPSLVS